MRTQNISFKNKEGQQLSAKLDLPVFGSPKAYAIFAHCFTCSKNLNAVRNISRALTQEGIAVLRFDFTGLGESEGEFANTNFSSNVDDLISASSFLQKNYDAPEIIIGHSLGGAAVLMAAHRLSSIHAIVTIAAPSDTEHLMHLFKENIDEIRSKGEATVNIGGRDFLIKEQLVDNLESNEVEKVIAKIDSALLIMHSPQDNIVSIEHAAKIYQKAKHPKSFITLDGADHLLSDQQDSLYVGNIIATWSAKYIDFSEEELLRTDKQVVCRTPNKGYTTEVKANNHHLLADEPRSMGGDDLGPTPYDLLAAALGTCTGITLRMYADRKGIDLEEVKVHLSHDKIHAEDCQDCDKNESKIDRLERIIELEGNLDQEERNRLIEIANKCPVHQTLKGDIKIKTSLMDQD